MNVQSPECGDLPVAILFDRLRLLALQAIVDFLSMHLDFLRRIYPNSHLVTLYSEHRHCNLIPDH